MWQNEKDREYLGDGLYAHFDGYGFELRANSYDTPSDKVYLEPEVLERLIGFTERIKKEKLGMIKGS
jgi:hypothetical protein